ncbi:hypothetical protein F5Y03DRAFT_405696 [Xylaria venustula]|nr:hypothetical protein F5Y03DRAFT_405696 [Xylaria venustula]
MRFATLATLQILSGIGLHVVSAQQLAYTVIAVTECITEASLMPELGVDRPALPPIVNTAPGNPGAEGYPETITVSYTMPPCTSCGCPGCTVVSSFTTGCQAFHTEGVKVQSYAIAETYVGLSSLPSFDLPTQMPYGFTAQVHTCDAGTCGPEAITATMTYPAGGGPFLATPAPAPVHDAVSSLSGDNNYSNTSAPHPKTETRTATVVPVPVPASPTGIPVSESGSRRPFEVIGVSVLLLMAAL